MNNDEKDKNTLKNETKALVRRILLYKYLCIIILTALLSFLIWFFFRTEIDAKDVAVSFFAAVITAFLLSIFYDLFTKKEYSIQLNEDRRGIIEHCANSICSSIDLGALSVEQKEELARRFLHNRDAMETLAKVISGQAGSKFLFKDLLSLWRGNVLSDVEVYNALKADVANIDYLLDFVQRFSVPQGDRKEFFIVFSGDNELFNSLLVSPVIIDCMVGLSDPDCAKITPLLEHLKLKATRTIDGVREIKEIKYREVAGEALQQRLGRGSFSARSVRGFTFVLPPNPQSYQYIFSYKVVNSLRDPYYYWLAENPMLVKSVTIDYSGLRKAVGAVSANCFIGNYSCDPMHDRDQGVYRIDIDGLLWPGQGSLIVWRTQ